MAAKYICFEGSEGTGKTTQIALVSQELTKMGYSVFITKEPGTPHSETSMLLRGFALNDAYSKDLTLLSREYLMQAIRSMHMEKTIQPNLDQYDFILQDRGMLSGLVYGISCGLSEETMETLSKLTLNNKPYLELYDQVIFFKGDVKKGLERALNAKQEYEAGDAMENQGVSFLNKVDKSFSEKLKLFKHSIFEVENKTIEQSTNEILSIILSI